MTTTPMTREQATWFAETFQRLVDNVGTVVLGKEDVIRLAFTTMLSEGHLLLEDAPGEARPVERGVVELPCCLPELAAARRIGGERRSEGGVGGRVVLGREQERRAVGVGEEAVGVRAARAHTRQPMLEPGHERARRRHRPVHGDGPFRPSAELAAAEAALDADVADHHVARRAVEDRAAEAERGSGRDVGARGRP